MFFKHLLLAVLISLLLTGVFIFGFRKRGPWNSFLIFFVVVALTAWAGEIWFPAIGPAIWGVYPVRKSQHLCGDGRDRKHQLLIEGGVKALPVPY
jgi:hypothetical protein